MISTQKIVGIIQMTKGDLLTSSDPNNYCIAPAHSSKIFNEIVIACPTGDLNVIEPYAKRWGINIIEGDTHNIGSRLLLAAKNTDAEIIVRLLIRQFYLDTDQLRIMINELIKQDGDYVILPDEYNYSLVGDTFKKSALQKAMKLIDKIADPFLKNSMKFAPFVYMEQKIEKFKPVYVASGPRYSLKKSKSIRDKYSRILNGEENKVETSTIPVSTYHFLINKYIKKNWNILDVSCGKGNGASLLSRHCKHVLGIDLDKNYIAHAKKNYSTKNFPNLDFEVDNAETFRLNISVDAVTSIHTMEHLNKPQSFLNSIKNVLKKNGHLFLEVPLLFPEPMNMPLFPFHVKEYGLQELFDFTKNCGFQISEVYVKKRHIIEKVLISDEGILEKPKGKITAALLVGLNV